MNKRIRQLAEQAGAVFEQTNGLNDCPQDSLVGDEIEKFAESIVRECLAIAKNREDELENANLLKESNAVGIVKYRIARQFGVKE